MFVLAVVNTSKLCIAKEVVQQDREEESDVKLNVKLLEQLLLLRDKKSWMLLVKNLPRNLTR